MTFELHPNFSSKIFIVDLKLCRVFLENEKNYPWLIAVPKKNGIKKIIDLDSVDQNLLYQELDYLQRLLWEEFSPDQLNVAAIGNITPQLHIHIIARFQSDPAWPKTVWDHPARSLYLPDELDHIKRQLTLAFDRKRFALN